MTIFSYVQLVDVDQAVVRGVKKRGRALSDTGNEDARYRLWVWAQAFSTLLNSKLPEGNSNLDATDTETLAAYDGALTGYVAGDMLWIGSGADAVLATVGVTREGALELLGADSAQNGDMVRRVRYPAACDVLFRRYVEAVRNNRSPLLDRDDINLIRSLPAQKRIVAVPPAASFLDSGDTPASFATHGGDYLRVNSDADAIEFTDPPSGGGGGGGVDANEVTAIIHSNPDVVGAREFEAALRRDTQLFTGTAQVAIGDAAYRLAGAPQVPAAEADREFVVTVAGQDYRFDLSALLAKQQPSQTQQLNSGNAIAFGTEPLFFVAREAGTGQFLFSSDTVGSYAVTITDSKIEVPVSAIPSAIARTADLPPAGLTPTVTHATFGSSQAIAAPTTSWQWSAWQEIFRYTIPTDAFYTISIDELRVDMAGGAADGTQRGEVEYRIRHMDSNAAVRSVFASSLGGYIRNFTGGYFNEFSIGTSAQDNFAATDYLLIEARVRQQGTLVRNFNWTASEQHIDITRWA